LNKLISYLIYIRNSIFSWLSLGSPSIYCLGIYTIVIQSCLQE